MSLVSANNLAKRRHDLGEVFLSNADPGIAHRDLDKMLIELTGDRNSPARPRELDRVGQEIEQDMCQLAMIGLDWRGVEIGHEVKSDRDLAFGGVALG